MSTARTALSIGVSFGCGDGQRRTRSFPKTTPFAAAEILAQVPDNEANKLSTQESKGDLAIRAQLLQSGVYSNHGRVGDRFGFSLLYSKNIPAAETQRLR